MARVRVRQHVNPLSSRYQQSIKIPNLSGIYTDMNKPLHLDIGCARGRFLWQMAQVEPEWNFLGLEIREPLVIEANNLRDEQGLNNLHYLFCNANISLAEIFDSLPKGILKRVSILFPDPWFKRRHQTRRVVQPKLVEDLANYLTVGGEIFLHSDVEKVAKEMCDRFSKNSSFSRTSNDWLKENILPVLSEREKATLAKNQPVYRALFMTSEVRIQEYKIG
ncbi:tRNA (guanosine(46)-N7)-methyltransferase TrmB [Okeania sp.]|uniref:tRNA (guanosine(46)-N7)-methyltransferase TrmB n=1 Tax=Okeania sp. TaxID=3100323 RepID=UPI002B4AB094|nr:tRNA (guanosine(46)-N7)-methyltransferase TrmB [Okeania sp.]MEB3339442.1 tRNA (guanosine(46)-N7)-methyltransferase TrmB [Okeania sp.]